MIFPDIFIKMFSDSAAMLVPGREALKLYFSASFYGISVFRTVYVCGSGKIEAGNILFAFAEGDYRRTADIMASYHVESRSGRSISGRTDFQYHRRTCLLLNNAAHCVERINAERKNENRKWRNQ